MFKAVIIDDEKYCRSSLSQDLEKYCPNISLTGEADSVKSGIDLINTANPDLVFLDVQMSDGTGFDVLSHFYKMNQSGAKYPSNFKVIFTTAYDEFAIKAIKFSALDYLLKPVVPEELVAAIDKFRQTSYRRSCLKVLMS